MKFSRLRDCALDAVRIPVILLRVWEFPEPVVIIIA